MPPSTWASSEWENGTNQIALAMAALSQTLLISPSLGHEHEIKPDGGLIQPCGLFTKPSVALAPGMPGGFPISGVIVRSPGATNENCAEYITPS